MIAYHIKFEASITNGFTYTYKLMFYPSTGTFATIKCSQIIHNHFFPNLIFSSVKNTYNIVLLFCSELIKKKVFYLNRFGIYIECVFFF